MSDLPHVNTYIYNTCSKSAVPISLSGFAFLMGTIGAGKIFPACSQEHWYSIVRIVSSQIQQKNNTKHTSTEICQWIIFCVQVHVAITTI